jgi:hypothetical protein
MPRNYVRTTDNFAMSWAFRQLSFWERVEAQTVIDGNGCHIFTGSKDNCGYGRIHKDKKLVRVHRAVYEKEYGLIKKGLEVMHSCDNPACINIDHLSIGTHADNMQDMYSKNRQHVHIGSSHGMAKLTETNIPIIRKRLFNGATCISIAKDYGVSEGMIRHIKHDRAWRHV